MTGHFTSLQIPFQGQRRGGHLLWFESLDHLFFPGELRQRKAISVPSMGGKGEPALGPSSWEVWAPAATRQGACKAGAVTVATFQVISGQLCSFQTVLCSQGKKHKSIYSGLQVGRSYRESEKRQRGDGEARNKKQRPLAPPTLGLVGQPYIVSVHHSHT